MSTTTMHFGPEWMRAKNQSLSRSHPPSPPPASGLSSGISTYSALVSATPPVTSDKIDDAHPFRYSKEELLNIYQEGGGKGGLGLEVERWEGVVREIAADPITLREMTEAEKKLFAGSLNSEIRRRPSQSADHFSPLNTSGLERPRVMYSGAAAANSPMRERFGGMKRKDSAVANTGSGHSSIPRKPSLPALQSPVAHSSRDAVSPRTRVGYTPSFDGVLNQGESWISRRRTSEASTKGALSSRESPGEQGIKGDGIREEREEDAAFVPQLFNGSDKSLFPSSPQNVPAEVPSFQGSSGLVNDAVDSRNNSSTAPGLSATEYRHDGLDISGVPDLTAVEWSYKDPTGQVQGPFRAELMQKWYEEGYFTPDLSMKRTHLDVHWTIVQDLVKQATSRSVFFTPPLPTRPPGLGRNSPTHIHNEPLQPAPTRSLRTSTLESYITGGSIASDSPSSSFNASQIGNSSPDPSILGGNDRVHANHDPNGRIGAFAFGLYDHPTSTYTGHRLNGPDFDFDHAGKIQGPSLGSLVSGMNSNINGHGFSNLHVTQDPWATPNHQVSTLDTLDIPSILPSSHVDHAHHGFAQERGFISSESGFPNHSTSRHSGSANYDLAGSATFTNAPIQHSFASQISNFPSQHPNHTYTVRSSEPLGPQVTYPLATNAVPTSHAQSPWTVIPNAISNNDVGAMEAPQPVTAPRNDSFTGGPTDKTTTYDEGTSAGSTIRHLGQWTNQEEVLDEKPVLNNPNTRTVSETVGVPGTLVSSSGFETVVQSSQFGSKISANTPPEPSVAAVLTRSAWAKDEDSTKKKGGNTSISLRAIQQAEAKKQESRKAAEREKEKARATTTIEDSQPFITSWGLPTSQAGARGSIALSARDVPPASPSLTAAPASPVWTTPLKTPAVKKSMKEIQEEEERRKKQALRESTATTAQKIAYVDSTKAVSPAPSINNVWTTVGPNGKTAAAALPPRPPAQTPFPPPGAPPASRSSATPVQRHAPISARPATTKPDEIPVTPSHEFLKWLGDSLKGLNNSANVEEIMSMLLSFPLDPDRSTVEIISDTIYANSTTLDGRRFAVEFVAKRKSDAMARLACLQGASNGITAKPVSIADVVKTVPKPSQPEWGFKVVNKKKKGGRS